jgi:hypothetical protein
MGWIQMQVVRIEVATLYRSILRYTLRWASRVRLPRVTIVKAFFAFAFATTFSAGYAQEEPKLASHCKPGETTYLNANMPELRYPQYVTEEERKTKPGWILKQTGKILSICVDRRPKSQSPLVYRFGAPDMVEFEKVATKSSPFYTFNRFESVTGNVVIFFVDGHYTYCVSEATGQGSGISLTVLKAGQEVASFFSGNGRGTEYETGFIDLSTSSTLRAFELKNKFQTPCDGKRLMRP